MSSIETARIPTENGFQMKGLSPVGADFNGCLHAGDVAVIHAGTIA